jgi:hypothetical protein
LGSALLLAAAPARLAAQQPLAFGDWSLFEWFFTDAVPPFPVEGDGFTVGSTTNAMRIRVTDLGTTGDAFNIFVNGSPFAQSPAVTTNIETGAFTGDAAWADPRLSKSEFELPPGQYLITLQVRQTADNPLGGEGYIRADLVAPMNVVPEPATVMLMATGLAALGLVARRRRHA